MTDYATMPAGPAMNAEIAVKVMGWPRVGMFARIIPIAESGVGGYVLPDNAVRRFVVGVSVEAWRPSEDVGHALEALDATVSEGYYQIDNGWRTVDDVCDGGHTCRIVIHSGDTEVTAPTRELAICRAILTALEATR